MPELTLAICTYRRLEPLRTTLQSLGYALHHAPGVKVEVLVVDNAARQKLANIPHAQAEAENPAIRDMVMGFAEVLPGLRYEVEAEAGTSFARNHAIDSARHPIVLFTDDDVSFDPQWLASMHKAIEAHPECAFWGGRVEPVAPPQVMFPPTWFDPERCPMLNDTIVQYRPGTQPRYWELGKDAPFYTANLALRVEAVRKAGMFDVNVGHRGAVRMGMEDSLMVLAIARQGARAGMQPMRW
ncbi:MAG: glycosyltransferase family 2 protein [Phycisphaerales bacterium]|nr:glycosyltransferase family 2 protein [Phycisphaerales bacterium]